MNIPKGNTNPSRKVWERLNKEGEAIEQHATAYTSLVATFRQIIEAAA